MSEQQQIKLPETVWNVSAAESSLERWLALCERENWKLDDSERELLADIFGASWYFTRFVFYRGQEALRYLNWSDEVIETGNLREKLVEGTGKGDTEQALERLRVNKNEIMLQIFTGFLTRSIDQAGTEAALTRLAENTLTTAIKIVFSEEDIQHFAILGMGRMAGEEMTFGSDLDLVFLYPGNSDELFARLGSQVRIFLREIASVSPAGILYEVDTRLRPHGNSGVLVTSAEMFDQYHSSDERETWERQMMTRCRPVLDETEFAGPVFNNTRNSIYRDYDRDKLRKDIADMRIRVERELGSPREKHDIKRGRGGIMDIDFITHYFQLAHGNDQERLRQQSTRKTLGELSSLGLLDEDTVNKLLWGYDFLKRLEACLRVHDMKSIDTISQHSKANHVVTRAMGYTKSEGRADTKRFMQDYQDTTIAIREIFTSVMGGD